MASAAITVRPSDATSAPGQTVAIEVFADPATMTAGTNEHLNAYTMTMSAIGFAGANDPSFVVPANFTFELNQDATHGYVFTATDPPFDPTGNSSRNLVFLSAAPGQADTDLNETKNGFGRVMVTIPAGAPIGTYTLRVDNDFLSLGGSAGTIDATGGTGTLTIVPEPASLGLVAIGGLLALRRRRTA
jgi:hypothetical protein